jgi:hypothetical protein
MCSTASIDEDRFAEKADIEVGITSVCSFVMAAAGHPPEADRARRMAIGSGALRRKSRI